MSAEEIENRRNKVCEDNKNTRGWTMKATVTYKNYQSTINIRNILKSKSNWIQDAERTQINFSSKEIFQIKLI
jgi:hypothetical protein